MMQRHAFVTVAMMVLCLIVLSQSRPSCAQSASAPADIALSALTTGEIRLYGRISGINAAQQSFVLDVTSFTLPNGNTSELTVPKPKTVLAGEETLLGIGRPTQKAAFADLKVGLAVAVAGKDSGSGKPLVARQIAIGNELTTLSPSSGAGQGGAGSGSMGSGLTRQEVLDLITESQKPLVQQIAELRAEIQRLKATPQGGAAAAPTGVSPAANRDLVGRAEINDLIAALRTEFSNRLSEEIQKVKEAPK
jgi:uncharacterized small protein (DUF1192 family)